MKTDRGAARIAPLPMQADIPLWAQTMKWGLPGVAFDPAPPGSEVFCATPILDLLRAAAERDPDAMALAGLTSRLTYRALLDLVRNVAASVSARVRPGGAIACLVPRSPDGVAAVLGCLVSGRICLIADTDYTAERLKVLLTDARPDAVLTAKPMAFEGAYGVLTLDAAARGSGKDWRPDTAWDPDAPRAVHFTSGSTGVPKGIVLSARSMLYRALDIATVLDWTAADRVFTQAAHVTGSNLSMVLGVLCTGACALVANLATDGVNAILRLCEREAVTVMASPPPVVRLLIASPRASRAFRAIRVLRAGAASASGADLAAWRRAMPRDCAVQHTYASTEALVVAQWFVPPELDADPGAVAAGIPQPLHDYAIVDADNNPVPSGETGELVLRGAYLALGEWAGGLLVPGPMIPAPGRPGARIFRTGDRVRISPDGLLRVLGRADRQFKVNGVRVEPGEVEAILKSDARVADAAAVLSDGPSGPELRGFVASGDPGAVELVAGLRRRLASALPRAARPARVIVLPALPMLPAGKIDLVALARWPID